MNIFYLDENPVLAAEFHCDKHVVKMILESAQLLSTAHRVLDGKKIEVRHPESNRKRSIYLMSGEEYTWEKYIQNIDGEPHIKFKLKFSNNLYAATHINHPSNVWARSSVWNYQWLYSLFINLLKEYTHRYGKRHKCEDLIETLKQLPVNIPLTSQTHIPLAMPHQCMIGSGVESYRHYYQTCKQDILVYTNRDKPFWLK